MAEATGSGITGMIGNSVGEAAAFAAGLAIGPLLEPILQEIKNKTWSGIPDAPLEASVLAQGVAEHKIDPTTAASEAKLTGIAQTPFNALVDVMRKSPGVAAGIELIRRGQLPASSFLDLLQKNGLETEWLTAYQVAVVNSSTPFDVPMDPAVVALGIVRDTVPDPGLQVGAHSTEGSDIPQGEQFGGDVLAEFAASGVDEERARVMVQNIGLPMPPVRAASAYFRGIINLASYYLSVAQSDSRPAWADAILEEARVILTPHDWVEARVRNWVDDAAMYAGTALHGMSQADTDVLYKITGRPLAVHQITTGLARGGAYPGSYANVPSPYDAAIAESNIREDFAELDYANRYTYPSGFEVKAEAQAGDLSESETEEILLEMGWSPKWAAFFAASWAAKPAAGKNLTSAQIKTGYRDGKLTEADALSRLEALGYSAGDAAIVLNAGAASTT